MFRTAAAYDQGVKGRLSRAKHVGAGEMCRQQASPFTGEVS